MKSHSYLASNLQRFRVDEFGMLGQMAPASNSASVPLRSPNIPHCYNGTENECLGKALYEIQ